jgi:undecaprenyl-diphosphatase
MASAIVLGIVQGIAEFLPISSSGHLALGQALLDVDPAVGGLKLNVLLHAGTLLAVLVVFRRDLWALLVALAPGSNAPNARRRVVAIIAGSTPLVLALIPAVERTVLRLEQSTTAVGIALLFTAAMLGFSHRAAPPDDDPERAPTVKQAVLIGLAQVVAIVPGISRSGSTIAAALGLGMGRDRAARFSFLLSVPAVGAATLKTGIEFFASSPETGGDLRPYAAGFFVSFVVGLASLTGLLRLIRRFGMLPFVPYLMIVGLLSLLMTR